MDESSAPNEVSLLGLIELNEEIRRRARETNDITLLSARTGIIYSTIRSFVFGYTCYIGLQHLQALAKQLMPELVITRAKVFESDKVTEPTLVIPRKAK